MAGFCLAESLVTLLRLKRIWGREEDASLVFAMGVDSEHTLG